MRPENSEKSAVKDRLLYGGLVGGLLGLTIGTMPGNSAELGLYGLLAGSALIGGLAVASTNFWDSMRAAWELVRVSFWRW
jgi:hypothetical protein